MDVADRDEIPPPPGPDEMCSCGHPFHEHYDTEEMECLYSDPVTRRFCRCDGFMRPGEVLDQV